MACKLIVTFRHCARKVSLSVRRSQGHAHCGGFKRHGGAAWPSQGQYTVSSVLVSLYPSTWDMEATQDSGRSQTALLVEQCLILRQNRGQIVEVHVEVN